jgi:hypothetical protein
MFCWNCGARNPDENSFCGRCGKRIASANAQSESLRTNAPIEATTEAPSIAEASPRPSNPLVEEPRAVHDTPREMVPAKVTVEAPREERSTGAASEKPRDEKPFVKFLVPEEPRKPVPAEPRKPKTLDEHFVPDEPRHENLHRLPPNRITGPSFLGLSDESTSDSDYLLEDDEPQRSSWRGWLAVAVLALLGFLIYKQWNTVQAVAHTVTDRAMGATQKQNGQPAPTPSNVSSSNEAQPADPSATKPPDPSATKSDATSVAKNENAAASEGDHASPDTKSATAENHTPSSVDKPENDQKDQTEASTSETAATTADAKGEPKTKEPSSDEEKPSATKKPATTDAAKAPRPDDAQVDQAQKYLRGQGVAQDCGRAISLLRSAAREGNPRAQVKLGALYATGQCVTQDRAAAYQWLARAQETQPTNSYLQRTMSTLWANMTPEERGRITH